MSAEDKARIKRTIFELSKDSDHYKEQQRKKMAADANGPHKLAVQEALPQRGEVQRGEVIHEASSGFDAIPMCLIYL